VASSFRVKDPERIDQVEVSFQRQLDFALFNLVLQLKLFLEYCKRVVVDLVRSLNFAAATRHFTELRRAHKFFFDWLVLLNSTTSIEIVLIQRSPNTSEKSIRSLVPLVFLVVTQVSSRPAHV